MDGVALADQNGEKILRSAVVNQWDYRVASLSSVAGKTISDIRLDVDGTTQPGQWDIYYQDIVFTGADGSVWPLFSQNSVAPGMSGFGTPGVTQMSETIHDCAGSGCAPVNTTTYFHDDQIGSARLLSEGYGYPVWQGTFTPFGQEASPELTTNHYKFNGKERGEASEGGLDNFGARSYSSVIGRWMTPDWSDAPSPIPYAKLTDPQSLNLYSFVTDDPLSHTDLDGHFQMAPASGSCPNNSGDSCTIDEGKPSINNSTDTTVDVFRTSTTTVKNEDGTTTVTNVITTATFSTEKGHEGQFVGATTETVTTTYSAPGTPIKEPVRTTTGPQAISYNGAVQRIGATGIAKGVEAATPGLGRHFLSAVGHDISTHPFRAIGRGIAIGVLVADPPTTALGAAFAFGTAGADLGESVQHAREEQ